MVEDEFRHTQRKTSEPCSYGNELRLYSNHNQKPFEAL